MASVGLEWYKTGTVNITQGSPNVTGVGTQWVTTGVKKGDMFTVDDTRGYEIASVASNTSITLVKPFQGASGNAQNYAIIRNWAATMTAELAARVAELVNKYESYIDSELNQIVGPKGDPGWAYKSAWASGRSYNALDIVAYNNALYVAIISHTSTSNNAPAAASGSAWMLLDMPLSTVTDLRSDISNINEMLDYLTVNILQIGRGISNAIGESGTVTITNARAWPFNNSGSTVALRTPRDTTDYTVTVEVQSVTGGAAGEVSVSNKLLNGFKLSFSGSATEVVARYNVTGGNV